MIPPRIDASATKNPLTAKVGDEVKVSVLVQGNPAPKVDWYVGGKIILPGTERYKIQASGFVHTLTIRPVSTSDSTIRVVARNPAGDHYYDQQLSFYKVLRKYSEDQTDLTETEKSPGSEKVVRRRKLRLYGGLSLPVLPSFSFLPKRKQGTKSTDAKLIPMKATLDDDELFNDPVPKVTRTQSNRETRTIPDSQYNSNILRSQSDYRVKSNSLPRRTGSTGSNISSPGNMDTNSLPRNTVGSRSSDHERFSPGSRTGSVSQLSADDVSVSIPSPQPLELQKTEPEKAKIRKSLELIPQYEKVAQKRGLESPKQISSKARHHSAVELREKEERRYKYGILTEKELENQIQTFFSPCEKPSSRVLVAHSFEDFAGVTEEGSLNDIGKDELFVPSTSVEMHILPEALYSDRDTLKNSRRTVQPYAHGDEPVVPSIVEPESRLESKPTPDKSRSRVTFNQLPNARESDFSIAKKLAPVVKVSPEEKSAIKAVNNNPVCQDNDHGTESIKKEFDTGSNIYKPILDGSKMQKPSQVDTNKNSIQDRFAAISSSRVPLLLANRRKVSPVQSPDKDNSVADKEKTDNDKDEISTNMIDDDSKLKQKPALVATNNNSMEDKFAAISVSGVSRLLADRKKQSSARSPERDTSLAEKHKLNGNENAINISKGTVESTIPTRSVGVYRVEPVEPNNNIWQVKNKEAVMNGNGKLSPTDLSKETSIVCKNEVIAGEEKLPASKVKASRFQPMQKNPLFSEYKEFVEELESFKPEEKEDTQEVSTDRRTSSPAPDADLDDSFCLNDDPAEVFDELERAAPPETSPFVEAAAFRPARMPPGEQPEGVLEQDVDDLLVNIDSPSRERSIKRKQPLQLLDSDESESVDSDLDEYAKRLEEEEEEMIIHSSAPHVHYEHLAHGSGDLYRPSHIIEETIPEEDSDIMEESPEDSTEEIVKDIDRMQQEQTNAADAGKSTESGLANKPKVRFSDEVGSDVKSSEDNSKKDQISVENKEASNHVQNKGAGGVDPNDILSIFERCLLEETSQDLSNINIPNSMSPIGDKVPEETVSHKTPEVPIVKVSNEYVQSQVIPDGDYLEHYSRDRLGEDTSTSDTKDRSSSGGSSVSDPSLDTCVDLLTDIPATKAVSQSKEKGADYAETENEPHADKEGLPRDARGDVVSPLRVPPVTDLDESSGADSDLDSYMVYLASKSDDSLPDEPVTRSTASSLAKDENPTEELTAYNNTGSGYVVLKTNIPLATGSSANGSRSSLHIARTSSGTNVGYLETDIDALSDETVTSTTSDSEKDTVSTNSNSRPTSKVSSQENRNINSERTEGYQSLYSASSQSDMSKSEEPEVRHRKSKSVELNNNRRGGGGDNRGNGWVSDTPGGASALDDSIAHEKNLLINSASWDSIVEIFWTNIWSFLMLLFALLIVHLLNPYFVDKSDAW